jgi:hypothetical protein
LAAATKIAAGEEVQVGIKAEFAPNLPRPGLVGVAINGVYHTCTPGAPKPTATVKVLAICVIILVHKYAAKIMVLFLKRAIFLEAER